METKIIKKQDLKNSQTDKNLNTAINKITYLTQFVRKRSIAQFTYIDVEIKLSNCTVERTV